MRIVLSSTDSIVKYVKNTAYDFHVQLPKPIHLQGHWTVSLTDLQIPLINKSVLICTDICENSIIGEKELPVLRRVTPDSEYIEFGHLNEIPIRIKHFQTIRIYIRDDNNSPVKLLNHKVTVTLEFKKKTFI